MILFVYYYKLQRSHCSYIKMAVVSYEACINIFFSELLCEEINFLLKATKTQFYDVFRFKLCETKQNYFPNLFLINFFINMFLFVPCFKPMPPIPPPGLRKGVGWQGEYYVPPGAPERSCDACLQHLFLIVKMHAIL